MMLHFVAQTLAEIFFPDKTDCLSLYIYGLELLISSVITTIILIAIGIITNSFFESIIFIIGFSALRVFTGGYHANSYWICTFITALNYFCVLFIYRTFFDYIASPAGMIIVWGLTLGLVLAFAPVDNLYKRLDETTKVKSKTRAIIVMLWGAFILLLCFYVFNIRVVIIILPTYLFVDILLIISILKKGEKPNVPKDKKSD